MHLEYLFTQTNRDGNLLWTPTHGDLGIGPLPTDPAYRRLLDEVQWQRNSLADEGEEDILKAFFQSATEPASLYGMLVNDTPVDTDTMASLTGEPTIGSNGYARPVWATDGTDWPTGALDGGDYQLTGLQRTITASGGSIGPMTYMCLVTVSTGTAGRLISYAALAASRTLSDGDSLNVTPSVKLA